MQGSIYPEKKPWVLKMDGNLPKNLPFYLHNTISSMTLNFKQLAIPLLSTINHPASVHMAPSSPKTGASSWIQKGQLFQ